MVVKYYSIISIITSILSIVICLLFHFIFGAKLRKITQKSKKYQYVYIVLICLTFLVFGVVIIAHSITSQTVQQTRGVCCKRETKVYQEQIIKKLKNSQSILLDGLNQKLQDFQISIEDLMRQPIRGVGNRIRQSVDMTKLVKQRLNDLTYKTIDEQQQLTRKPTLVTWFDYANLIFYILCILLAICSLAPILAAVIVCLKRHGPPPLVKPSTIIRCAMCVSFVAVLATSAWFAAMTMTGGFAAHENCELAVNAALADEYRVKTMNTDMRLVEKIFPQSCSSSQSTTYFTNDQNLTDLISTLDMFKIFAYNSYKLDVTGSIITLLLPQQQQSGGQLLSPKYAAESAKIARLAAALAAMMPPNSCVDTTTREPQDLSEFTSTFGKLAAEMPKYQKAVEQFGQNEMGEAFLRKAAEAYFDEEFVPIREEFEKMADKILQTIKSADFSCQSLTSKRIECSKCDEMDHLGLFFSALFGISLLSLIYQALPSPWNRDEQQDTTGTDSMTPTKTKTATTTASTDPNEPTPIPSPDYLQKTIFDDAKIMTWPVGQVSNVATAKSNPQLQRKKSIHFKK